jgi:transposase
MVRPMTLADEHSKSLTQGGVEVSSSGVWRILKRLGMSQLPASQRYIHKDRRWKRFERQQQCFFHRGGFRVVASRADS